MKKGKRAKKEIKFNLADYDYMDDMPLGGWIWEFMRRSDEYYCGYYELEMLRDGLNVDEEKTRKYIEILTNLDLGPFQLRNPLEKWNEGEPPWLSGPSKFEPVEVFNLKWGIRLRKREWPDGEIEYVFDKTSDGKGVYLEPHGDASWGFINDDGEVEIRYEAYKETCTPSHPFHALREEWEKENVLMVLIDISAPSSVDDILRSLKPSLLWWRRALKLPRTRAPKKMKKTKNFLIQRAPIWKSYLIIYDLSKQDMSNREIADLLFSIDTENYQSEEKIREHLKNAVAMINGGYKQYF